MANPNLKDPPPKGSWRRNHDIHWIGTTIGDVNKPPLGIGQKALGGFVIGDTDKVSQRWKKTVFRS